MPLPGPVSHLQWRFIWALVSASNATSRRSWLHRLGSWLASAATNPEQLIQVVVADGQDDGRPASRRLHRRWQILVTQSEMEETMAA
jgi:hypothetical protein